VNFLVRYHNAITKPKPEASRVNNFSKEYILESRDLPVGTEVHIFGYPTSVGVREMPQLELTQPLLRKVLLLVKITS